jgi:hypothetical protein
VGVDTADVKMLPQTLRGLRNCLILEFAAAIQRGVLNRVTYKVAVRTKFDVQRTEVTGLAKADAPSID